jgi:hypothetical protein
MDNNWFGGFDGGTGLLRMWSDCMTRMMQAAPNPPESTPPEAMRRMRATMLDTWAEWWDQWLRSPQFLEMMKQSMAGSVQARKEVNDLLGQMHHEFQGPSRQDIDQLMLTIRRMEQRVVDGVERVSAQLEELSARLDGDDEPTESSPPAASPNGRTPAPRKHRNRKAT